LERGRRWREMEYKIWGRWWGDQKIRKKKIKKLK
jgi:hypothetical protein